MCIHWICCFFFVNLFDSEREIWFRSFQRQHREFERKNRRGKNLQISNSSVADFFFRLFKNKCRFTQKRTIKSRNANYCKKACNRSVILLIFLVFTFFFYLLLLFKPHFIKEKRETKVIIIVDSKANFRIKLKVNDTHFFYICIENGKYHLANDPFRFRNTHFESDWEYVLCSMSSDHIFLNRGPKFCF